MNFLKVRFIVGDKVFYLPATGCDVYQTPYGYQFDIPKGGNLILSNHKFEYGILDYDANEGVVKKVMGGESTELGTELVELFLAQTPDLHPTIKEFLLLNPQCLDCEGASFGTRANPHTWSGLSTLLTDCMEDEDEPKHIEHVIYSSIGDNIASEKFLEYLKSENLI